MKKNFKLRSILLSPNLLLPHNGFQKKSRTQTFSFGLIFFALPLLLLTVFSQPTYADTELSTTTVTLPTTEATTTSASNTSTTVSTTGGSGGSATSSATTITQLGGIASRSAGLVVIDPQDLSVLIADGLECSSTRAVQVKLTGRNVTQFVLSEDAQFVGVSWQDFPLNSISPETKSIDWELSLGDGEKTLYVIFRSSTGDTSEVMKDAIRLNVIEACGEVTTLNKNGEEIEVLGEEIEKIEQPECSVECSRVSYRIYIMTPTGERRYMESIYAKIENLENNTKRVRFEDSGMIDQDFNDVSIMVDDSNCQNLRFSLEKTLAAWHHKIGVEIVLDNEIKQDTILWQDSHIGEGLTLSINGASDQAMCEEESIKSQLNTSSIVLYENPNYQGRFQMYSKDDTDLKLHVPFFNDNVASIRLVGKIAVFLYNDKDFNGHEERLTIDDSDLGDNIIDSHALSSFKILPLAI